MKDTERLKAAKHFSEASEGGSATYEEMKEPGGHIQEMPPTALQQMKKDFEAMGFKFPLPEPLQMTLITSLMTLVHETTQQFTFMMTSGVLSYCKTIHQATAPTVAAVTASPISYKDETPEDKQKRQQAMREHFDECPMCGNLDGFEDECCTCCGLPVQDCTCPRPGPNRCRVCSLLEANCQCYIFDNPLAELDVDDVDDSDDGIEVEDLGDLDND